MTFLSEQYPHMVRAAQMLTGEQDPDEAVAAMLRNARTEAAEKEARGEKVLTPSSVDMFMELSEENKQAVTECIKYLIEMRQNGKEAAV